MEIQWTTLGSVRFTPGDTNPVPFADGRFSYHDEKEEG